MLREYKIFAGNMIVESDNTKELKMQLLNFVKDAAEPQVKNFILNGTVVESIKEKDIVIINEQFEEVINEVVLGLAILGASLWGVWRGLGAAASKDKAKCGVFAIGSKRALCLATAGINTEKKKIGILQKASANCKTDKNPQKCMLKIKAMILKSQNTIKNHQAKLKKGQMKGQDVAAAKAKAQGKKEVSMI